MVSTLKVGGWAIEKGVSGVPFAEVLQKFAVS
jgi:hypothetical protein